ncbi:MAG: nickel pincer cofactor biosynthesis protein LarC [Leptolyngbya sp. SIO3F4]|nr:nickel pincer cofactor biosynthesis protein LarC [Leptolyngbya sp. SIO3F4]
MEKIAYFDCPTGIAGNMCLGAILAAGMPRSDLLEQLNKLGLEDEYEFTVAQVKRQEQAATAVTIKLHKTHGHRHLPAIETLIQQANLSPRVTDWSLAIFRKLAAAEAAVHGIAPEQVHFHEVGATDAIVDVVGTCLGLDWLGIDQIICSPLPIGGGTVKAAHGQLPVPAPAVLELFRQAQVPIYSNGINKELVTPTGAAIATALSQYFGPPPAMTLQQVGLGAGSHDLPIPNILRLWIGTASESLLSNHHQIGHSQPHHHSKHQHSDHQHSNQSPHLHSETNPTTPGYSESVIELQTQLDDLTPQAIGYLYEGLLKAGALDVFTQAVGMKKNRPGILLTVICNEANVHACQALLFLETTTLGIRKTVQQRQALYRTWQSVMTTYGPVQIKAGLATPNGPVINLQPEYETCANLARDHGVGWKRVQWNAIAAAHPLYEKDNWNVTAPS